MVALVNVLGIRIWLLHPKSGESESGLLGWSSVQILSIVGFAIVLRLIYSGTYELLHAEAYYWDYAQHLSIGYLDHPPMVAWLIWVFTGLLGHTEFTVRLSALTCWLMAAYYVYKLTLATCGHPAALQSLLLTAVLPLFFGIREVSIQLTFMQDIG
ncbi:ArnT family glycosyltransferase [Planctomycetota bacterium]